MAIPHGTFSREIMSQGWFHDDAVPQGWFDETLLEPSAGGVDGNAFGATIVATASILAGAATGSANAAGQAINGNITIVNGVASGTATASGGVVVVAVSLIAGEASAEVGQVVTGGGLYDIRKRNRKRNERAILDDDDDAIMRVIEEFMRLAA